MQQILPVTVTLTIKTMQKLVPIKNCPLETLIRAK
jgi:hypothetical protein